MPQDSGYFVDDSGLCYIAARWNPKEKRMDFAPAEWICAPFKVLFRARNLDGTGWRLILEITDRDGARREITIMDAEIGGQDGQWFRALADAGLKIHPKKRAELAHYLLIESDAAPRAWAVEKTGWTRDSYVLPHRTIGTSAQPILFQGQDRTAAFAEAGTAEEWREHVGKACIGNSRLILAATAGLASTLLPFSGMADSGGFHYYGHSSVGKTTALGCRRFDLRPARRLYLDLAQHRQRHRRHRRKT
jgi:putative DNA primase/helicase